MSSTITLQANHKNIEATVHLPASKSISNRVLIIQSLCADTFEINNLSTAHDTVTLQQLLHSNQSILNAGDGGTTFRFLLAHAALKGDSVFLTGSKRMLQRPIEPMVTALNNMGANIEYAEHKGFAPLNINSSVLHGGEIEMDAGISSQFITALLLIAPYLQNGLTIKLKGLEVSAPYTQMTIALMQEFGVEVNRVNEIFSIKPQQYKAQNFNVEPDWSAASYWYAVAALSESATILFPNLSANSLQGDQQISSIMEKLGVTTMVENGGITIHKNNRVLPDVFEYDFLNCPDLFQTICVVCAALNIPSRFTGLQTLPLKETNRLAALQTELLKTGAEVSHTTNSFDIIKGISQFTDVIIDTHNDHRMAMAFAPLALIFKSITIQNPTVVIKSYPDFWKQLTATFKTS